MKNRKAYFWLITFLIITISIFLSGCRDDPNYDSVAVEENRFPSLEGLIVNDLNLDQIPEISEFLEAEAGKTLFRTDKSDVEIVEGAIFNEERVLMVTDSTGRSTYALEFFYADTPDHVFYNLIVGIKSNGEMAKPYILEYRSNPEDLQSFMESGMDYAHFNGEVMLHKFKAFFTEGEIPFLDKDPETYCPSDYDEFGDPIPCITYSMDASSDGSSGAGGTAGGSSGGTTDGGAGTGSSLESCKMYTYVINCGGTSTDTYHLASLCQGPNQSDAYYVNVWICPQPLRVRLSGKDADCSDCEIPSTEAPTPVNTVSTNTFRLDMALGSTLTDSQLDWLDQSVNYDTVWALRLFLAEHGYSEEVKDFVKQTIWALMAGAEVYLEERFSNFQIVNNINSFFGDNLSIAELNYLSLNTVEASAINTFLIDENNSSQARALVSNLLDSAEDGTLVSAMPLVKYPENSTYETDYPKLTEYLKNELPKIADNQMVVDAIHDYTDAPVEIIKDALQWGKGPEIIIDDLEGERVGSYRGFFDSSELTKLHLDVGLVEALENTPTIEASNALSFFIAVTILHEYNHLGDTVYGGSFWGNGWLDCGFCDENEVGKLFEGELFNEEVWWDNYEIIFKRTGGF